MIFTSVALLHLQMPFSRPYNYEYYAQTTLIALINIEYPVDFLIKMWKNLGGYFFCRRWLLSLLLNICYFECSAPVKSQNVLFKVLVFFWSLVLIQLIQQETHKKRDKFDSLTNKSSWNVNPKCQLFSVNLHLFDGVPRLLVIYKAFVLHIKSY